MNVGFPATNRLAASCCVSFFFGFGRLRRCGACGERDLVEKARIVALGDQLGIVGDGVEQGLQPVLIGFGEVAQHMRVDAVLVAGMTDADPEPLVVLAAMGVDGFETVVTAIAATGLELELARMLELLEPTK